jgi:hypothetical protein
MKPRTHTLVCLLLTVPLLLFSLDLLALDLPTISGSTADIKSSFRSKFSEFMELVGLVIGAGGLFAIAVAAFLAIQRMYREARASVIGAAIGLFMGGSIVAVARLFVT